MRPVRCLVALGLLTTVLAGCGDSSPSAGALAGPGTAVFDGLTVADGSQLVGVVPDVRYGGHVAMLLVDGDPAAVFDRYAAQLARMGIALAPSEGNNCVRGIVEVDAFAPSDAGPSQSLSLYWSDGKGRRPWAQFLILREHRSSGASRAPVDVDLDAVGPTPGSLSARTAPPPIPAPGARVSTDSEIDPTEALTVVDGSRLLAPPSPSCGVTGGGYAFLSISGDPQTVVDEYVKAVDDPPTTKTTTVDGQPVIFEAADSAGGPKIDVAATRGPDGHWVALIELSND